MTMRRSSRPVRAYTQARGARMKTHATSRNDNNTARNIGAWRRASIAIVVLRARCDEYKSNLRYTVDERRGTTPITTVLDDGYLCFLCVHDAATRATLRRSDAGYAERETAKVASVTSLSRYNTSQISDWSSAVEPCPKICGRNSRPVYFTRVIPAECAYY